MSLAVSLCVLRVELSNDTVEEKYPGSCGAMAEAADSEKIRAARGRREMRDITVETYPNDSGEGPRPSALISGLDVKEMSPVPVMLKDPKLRRSCEPECLEPGFKCREELHFISGNPFVEVTKGILHLFKEDELTTMERAAQRSQTVCILAVPAAVTCNDLMNFTAACHEDIRHLRIIRNGSPNQYMALLTFRTTQSASEFYATFNGAAYNSMEPDQCCHLVFVSRVETVGESRAAALPLPLHTELPTCPVCLERMDESVDGILTVLCNHSFHATCLAKWGDTSCPVCRYVQTPELVADNRCLECHAADSLWICLICGHVGCGRYVQGHAYQHYLQTQHCYSMQLGNNRVWDYVGDNFVHRLLQNKGDGKLVEGGVPDKERCEEKLDSVQLEFTYLLTSQLDSQRLYFEERMARIEQDMLDQVVEAKEKANKAMNENTKLHKALHTLGREKQAADRRVVQVSARLTSTLAELQEEKEMGRALQRNQGEWQERFSTLESEFAGYKEQREKELTEVREQLRDVMFFLEAQNKIAECPERDEIAEGRIVIGEAPKPSASGKGQRRRRNR